MLELVDERASPLELQIKHDEAFDVEEVTREFYERYTDIFHILSEDIAEENPREDTYKEAQIILDRLIFLYFIQKKGWLNNNKRYLYENFLKFWKKEAKGNSFYSDFLIKLFQALSSQGNLYKETLGDVPFLNGGLFEVDPFHSKLPFRLVIGNDTFKQIFDDLLERFNFTVREDTPLDVEVAIDPEMLGKIFENLVLKLERGEDLRRKTGSYYTPRVIVHFMCQQSLKEYLVNESEISRSKIDLLFTMSPTGQLSEDELKKLKELISVPQARLLRSLINKAYILDPAVGSGAFLVGMLHEMLSIVRLVDIREFGLECLQRGNYDYELRRQLIETSLYGVDIQEQAVRICELRLWLSLIVDYEKAEGEDVPPLPNLSYRIRCGDSLIEKLFGHNVQLNQLVKIDKGRQLIDEITENKEAYFLARNIREKNRIELSTLAKQCELMELLIKEKQKSLRGPQLSFFEETAKERREREEFEKTKRGYDNILFSALNTRRKVDAMLKGKISIPAEDIHNLREKLGISFIWKLDFAEVFKEKDGFDIVIANPPYNAKLSKAERNLFKNKYESVKSGRQDTAAIFVELAKIIGNKNMQFAYILPYRLFSRKRNHGQFQVYTINNFSIKKIIYLGANIGFSSKDEFMILIMTSTSNKDNQINVALKPNFDDFGKEYIYKKLRQSALVERQEINLNLVKFDQSLLSKIRDKTLLLGVICCVKDGIVPFIREKLISDKKIDDRYVRFAGIAGKYILQKYFFSFDELYLCYDINEAKKYIKNISELRKVQLREKEIFLHKKILTAQNSAMLKGAIDDRKTFVSNSLHSTYLRNEFKKQFSLEYILALINSNLLNYYHDSLRLKGTDLHPQILISDLKKLPVKNIRLSEQKPFVNLVNKILAIIKDKDYLQNKSKQTKVQQLERQIDQKVYELYGLTDEEIALVEGKEIMS